MARRRLTFASRARSIRRSYLDGYWQEQIRTHGRRVFFIDTGGILKLLEGDQAFGDFFDSVVGDQIVTSTYVLSEVVRRIVKTDHPSRFKGPTGEVGPELALYVLTEWLETSNVRVICPPEEVFDYARQTYSESRGIGCDLVDIISFVIVEGFEQKRIISPDNHFRILGLICYPG
jgi:predicted nucleic acid-binding protein